MIKLEELKNMAAALTEIRSLEQINEQYLEDFLLENFTEDEIKSIADLDEYDMQSFVETIGEDLDADELNAFLEESVHGQQQLDELIGAAARLVGRGIKKAAKRMTVAGRADAAERKVKKLQKRRVDRERLKKAKSQLQTMRNTRREELDPVGKEDDDIDNDGDVDASVNEISDKAKRNYLDRAVDDHYQMFTGRKPTTKNKLDKRRASIQKTAKAVTGKKHFSDPDGEPHNAGDWWKGKKYSNESAVNEAVAKIAYTKCDEKKMDKVDKDAVKGDFDDREDKDIDNDGDVDTSDRYLHNRRKVITKAMKKEETDLEEAKEGDMIKYRNIKTKRIKTGIVRKVDTKNGQKRYELDGGKYVYDSDIEEADLDEAVEVRHDRYMRSHGKRASGGTGSWMFTHKDMGNVNYNDEKEVYTAPRGKFSDAKKAAQQWAKKHGHSTVYVMESVELEEKAESEAQAIAARIALKHKREGTKPEPGTASAEMMKMSEKDLEDFTKMKKGAPYKVEESTDLTEDAWEEIPMMKRQLHYIKYAADEIMEYMNMTADPEEWFQNKLAHVHDQMQSLHAYIEGDKRMIAMEATGLGEAIKVKSGRNKGKWRHSYSKSGEVWDTEAEADAAYKKQVEKNKNTKVKLKDLEPAMEATDLNEDITKMSHGRLKWHMNTGVPHGSYTNDEMKKERDRRLKNRDSADAYKKAKAGLSENFMEATDAEIRTKQTAGATKPEGIADKESEGSKKFMMMHTTQVPGEVNVDEINRMNAEEIKASLQRKVSYRWNDQKIGDK